MKKFSHLWQYLPYFFLEWEMFQIKLVEKIEIHVLCSVTFSRKACRLWVNVEKCGRASEAADDNMAHGRCMLQWFRIMYTYIACLVLTLRHFVYRRSSFPHYLRSACSSFVLHESRRWLTCSQKPMNWHHSVSDHYSLQFHLFLCHALKIIFPCAFTSSEWHFLSTFRSSFVYVNVLLTVHVCY